MGPQPAPTLEAAEVGSPSKHWLHRRERQAPARFLSIIRIEAHAIREAARRTPGFLAVRARFRPQGIADADGILRSGQARPPLGGGAHGASSQAADGLT